MAELENKIEFYNLESEKLHSVQNIDEELDENKIVSEKFNRALAKVVNSDIDKLDNKMNNIVLEMKKFLISKDINCNINSCYGIKEIRNILDYIDENLKVLKSDNQKIGFFTLHKKKKKKAKKNKEAAIEYLEKTNKKILLMETEYKKLLERRDIVIPSIDYETNIEKTEEFDPLERTINFYIKKEERL